VTDDFDKLDLNTNVAALMELSNALGEFNVEPAAASVAMYSRRAKRLRRWW